MAMAATKRSAAEQAQAVSGAELKRIVEAPVRAQPVGDPLIDNFRAAVAKRAGRSGFRGLVQVLRRLDDNGDKRLSRQELQQGLDDYGLPSRAEDVDRLFRQFDRNKDGSVSVTEFVRGIRPAMAMARRDLVMQAYQLLDVDQSGVVTLKEVQSLYDASRHPEVLAGKKTVEEVVAEFMASWDRDGDHRITPAEFIEYYSDLSAGIDNDVYFELMIRNAWHISGGEGAAQNTTCLRCLVHFEDGRQAVVEVRNDLGLDRTDVKAVTARLQKQGLKQIKKIELSSAPA